MMALPPSARYDGNCRPLWWQWQIRAANALLMVVPQMWKLENARTQAETGVFEAATGKPGRSCGKGRAEANKVGAAPRPAGNTDN
jgi:hypothetical protein